MFLKNYRYVPNEEDPRTLPNLYAGCNLNETGESREMDQNNG